MWRLWASLTPLWSTMRRTTWGQTSCGSLVFSWVSWAFACLFLEALLGTVSQSVAVPQKKQSSCSGRPPSTRREPTGARIGAHSQSTRSSSGGGSSASGSWPAERASASATGARTNRRMLSGCVQRSLLLDPCQNVEEQSRNSLSFAVRVSEWTPACVRTKEECQSL